MILRVTQFGEPVLREKGQAVLKFDPSLRDLAQSMIDTMREAHGIGLASQQVGLPSMLCVVDLFQEGVDRGFDYSLDGKKPPLELIMPMVMVNPHILSTGKETTFYDEGCLSFPGIGGEVERPDRIEVSFQDLEGHPHRLECDGLFSRCIQHEIDHLHGILFIDRMDKDSLRDARPAIRRLKERTQRSIRRRASEAEAPPFSNLSVPPVPE